MVNEGKVTFIYSTKQEGGEYEEAHYSSKYGIGYR